MPGTQCRCRREKKPRCIELSGRKKNKRGGLVLVLLMDLGTGGLWCGGLVCQCSRASDVPNLPQWKASPSISRALTWTAPPPRIRDDGNDEMARDQSIRHSQSVFGQRKRDDVARGRRVLRLSLFYQLPVHDSFASPQAGSTVRRFARAPSLCQCLWCGGEPVAARVRSGWATS